METNNVNTSATATTSTNTPTITTPAPVNMATSTPATTTPASVDKLPANYLTEGYYQGEGKSRYPDPDLIDQAEAIAKALAESGTPPTAINRMVKTLKVASRLPYPAQQGAIKKLMPQVLDLEHKKKAPPMLRQVVERNQATVKDEADFKACLSHFQDIAIYLTAARS